MKARPALKYESRMLAIQREVEGAGHSVSCQAHHPLRNIVQRLSDILVRMVYSIPFGRLIGDFSNCAHTSDPAIVSVNDEGKFHPAD